MMLGGLLVWGGTDKFQQLVPAMRKIQDKEETKNAKSLSHLAIKGAIKVTWQWFDLLATETYLKVKPATQYYVGLPVESLKPKQFRPAQSTLPAPTIPDKPPTS